MCRFSTDNSSILSLFKQGKIDGAWVPEPYATRLVVEDKGKSSSMSVRCGPTDNLSPRTSLSALNSSINMPDLVSKFFQADIETVQYIQNNQQSAKTLVNSQIKQISGKGVTSSELTWHITI